MELALLVYAISLLPKLNDITRLIMVLGGAALFVTGFAFALFLEGGLQEWWQRFKPIVWIIVPIFILAGIVNTALPSEKTAYTMVGAYAAQKIVTDPRTVEVGGKVMTIINQKLDYYVKQGADEIINQVKPK